LEIKVLLKAIGYKKAAKSFSKLNRYIVIFSNFLLLFWRPFLFFVIPPPESKKAALFNITLIRDIRQNGF